MNSRTNGSDKTAPSIRVVRVIRDSDNSKPHNFPLRGIRVIHDNPRLRLFISESFSFKKLSDFTPFFHDPVRLGMQIAFGRVRRKTSLARREVPKTVCSHIFGLYYKRVVQPARLFQSSSPAILTIDTKHHR